MKFLTITLRRSWRSWRSPTPTPKPSGRHRAAPELFQSEIAPVLRAEIPSRPFPQPVEVPV
ncbi:hypothetical protein [Spongiactinospora sp. TRM90649]|uniref:hypothetical protein n=1 Tax=Spongiactinospora sp. TRM90649 TaxID=3031114 RepID=UPI0023F6C916|nr:hypothetical protein [Spongiactinospora sp. TRM90649]MDF5758149.1 hypothetical protein [Spongiactinospora sp. TRM90649]